MFPDNMLSTESYSTGCFYNVRVMPSIASPKLGEGKPAVPCVAEASA